MPSADPYARPLDGAAQVLGAASAVGEPRMHSTTPPRPTRLRSRGTTSPPPLAAVGLPTPRRRGGEGGGEARGEPARSARHGPPAPATRPRGHAPPRDGGVTANTAHGRKTALNDALVDDSLEHALDGIGTVTHSARRQGAVPPHSLIALANTWQALSACCDTARLDARRAARHGGTAVARGT